MDFKTVLSNYGYNSEDQLLDEMIVEANKEIVAKKYIRKAISDDEINKYYEDEIYGDYNAKHILIKADTSDDASKEEQENFSKDIIEDYNTTVKDTLQRLDVYKYLKEVVDINIYRLEEITLKDSFGDQIEQIGKDYPTLAYNLSLIHI